jgi:formate dehydrogenase alpha subunit
MKLTIDGREITCQAGPTLLEVARGAGISIPSLCDHPDLVPFAGCRICLVEVSGRKDPVPACATAAEEGMTVRTRTPEIVALRKKVLELILAEHPYACLVCAEKATCDDLKSTIRKVGEVTGCVLCPANGGCELQKVAEEVGLDKVDLPAVYRNQEVRRGDPFFDRDYNLCILCGRCIRVCEEVRGASVLSFIQRGDRTEVGTAFDRPLLDSGCRFCGACVDVCPTGALVERAVRPQPRPGRSAEVVCPFCGQGCVLRLRIRDDKVLSAGPSDAAPNRGQACVKGRFLVRSALHGPGRILEPHVRKDGRLSPATFEEALDRAAGGLLAAPDGRRALIYPSQVSLEDAFLFLEFGREIMKSGSVAAGPAPAIGTALDAFAAEHGSPIPASRELAEIEECGAILAWDIDLPKDHPIAWLKVVRAVRRGAGFVAAGTVPAGPIGQAAVALKLEPDSAAAAACLAAVLLESGAVPAVEDGFEDFKKALASRSAAMRGASPAFRPAAGALATGKPAVLLFDAGAITGPSGAETLTWLWNIALLIGARLVPLGRGANERGVHELEKALGFPASGKAREDVWAGLPTNAFDALYLAGPAPDLEDRRPPFVVCQDTHWSRNAERADVVLPAAAFAEVAGTWINTEGRVRNCLAAVPSPGSAKPDGMILGELARRMGRPDFVRTDAAALIREIRDRIPALAGYDPAAGADQAYFLREQAREKPRFVPVAPPAGVRAQRPATKPSFEAGLPGDSLRGYDPVAQSRGYAKIRRVG